MNYSKIKLALLHRLPLSLQFLIEVITFWVRLCRYNASANTNNSRIKMQFTLLRENHIIEKGMSIKHTRLGFGQTKVAALINRLETYHRLYGTEDNSFITYPLSTISEYLDYQKKNGILMDDLENSFKKLCTFANIDSDSLNIPAGIKYQTKMSIQSSAKGNFESLLYSRHSVRNFSDELPSRETLDKALTLASRTPSACNRQAWHTHIYFQEDSHNLLKMQDGCKGFHDDIHCCIVVTADMMGFLSHEPFQCYIDGGLYSQNLINALHYVGLGTIPLSCGFMTHKLDKIKKTFEIPDNEVMIVIIGVGCLVDQTKIAVSTRKPIEATNKYHDKLS